MQSQDDRYGIVSLRNKEAIMQAHQRHDITELLWSLLEPHLLGKEDSWGGQAKDNRQFINAVFWIMRTGAPWRDLPPDYGGWSNIHRQFIRWCDKGYGKNF